MVVLLVPVTLILVQLSAETVLGLPVLTDGGASRGHGWGSATLLLPRRSPQQSAWLEDLLGGGELRPRQQRPSASQPQDSEGTPWAALGIKRGARRQAEVVGGAAPPPRRPAPAKRTEVTKIPVGLGKGARYFPNVGLGVLSDLRNFFTELRTNLDSVEALAQEQGAGRLQPEQLLALLAKEEARSQALAGLPSDISSLGLPMRSLMFTSSPNDQRYANSGLGK
ncbi:uncharacterized protein LOC127005706 isoform X1 [Eriocheir sinensis]|uniref:uncharacterized protein LOC127005706 isoform X1 n=1 Tax=Eriocheir sinensis TaxID=95602 RepID=UPI0021C702E5|nr:uncharacterized protein LOC127005706 isoform X1 [Eriocheir sinensis]